MIRDIITLVVGNYFLTFLIIGLIAGLLSLGNKPKPRSMNVIAEALLSYYMLFAIGINNIVNFVFHVFFGDMAAQFIGWEQSPSQAEVGYASLGMGIVASWLSEPDYLFGSLPTSHPPFSPPEPPEFTSII